MGKQADEIALKIPWRRKGKVYRKGQHTAQAVVLHSPNIQVRANEIAATDARMKNISPTISPTRYVCRRP
jgi:hypothetical protein